MLYVVGGCGRSGKSSLAEHMCARHGVPWFTLDALMMGLYLGEPSLSIHPDDDDQVTADRMWPFVKGALEHFIWDGRDYLVEGVFLRPQTVAQFIKGADSPVRACFLGYPNVDIEIKAAQLANFAGLPNDWLNRKGPDDIRRYLEISRTKSRLLKTECDELGIPFIDTSVDFDKWVLSAELVLLDPA